MREAVKFSESEGRTIEAVRYSVNVPQAVVTFTDGTYAVIGRYSGYERSEDELIDDELALFDFGDSMLEAIGVVGDEEIAAARVERAAAENRRALERQRIQYESLKKKFEQQ